MNAQPEEVRTVGAEAAIDNTPPGHELFETLGCRRSSGDRSQASQDSQNQAKNRKPERKRETDYVD